MAIFTTNYYKIILFDHPTAIIRNVPEHIASPRKILEGVRECKEVPSTCPEDLGLQIWELCIFRSGILVAWNPNTEQWSILVLLLGNCLLDLPRTQILGPEELPGQTYDATQQCNLTFGPEYSVCPGMDVCARLWCAVVRQGQMVCLTKKLPAVEGTPCGKGRICLQGKCVDKTKKKYYSVSGLLVTQCLGTQDLKSIPVTCVGTVTEGFLSQIKYFSLRCPSRAFAGSSLSFGVPRRALTEGTVLLSSKTVLQLCILRYSDSSQKKFFTQSQAKGFIMVFPLEVSPLPAREW